MRTRITGLMLLVLPLALPLTLAARHAASRHTLARSATAAPFTPSVDISGPTSITSSGTYNWDLCAHNVPSYYTLRVDRVGGTEIVEATNDLGQEICVEATLGIAFSQSFTLSGKMLDVDGHTIASTSLNVVASIPETFSLSIDGPGVVTAGLSYEWDADASGGTPPYTFQWQDASTSSAFTTSFADEGEPYDTQIALDGWDATGTHVHTTRSIHVCPSPLITC
jgi:hypothetical protein